MIWGLDVRLLFRSGGFQEWLSELKAFASDWYQMLSDESDDEGYFIVLDDLEEEKGTPPTGPGVFEDIRVSLVAFCSTALFLDRVWECFSGLLPRNASRPVTKSMQQQAQAIVRGLVSCTLGSFQVRVGVALCEAGVRQATGPVSKEVMTKVLAIMEEQAAFEFDRMCLVRVVTIGNWRERVRQGTVKGTDLPRRVV